MEKTESYLHPRAFAAGLTAGVAYIICAAVVTLWPTQALSFFANQFHGIDLTKIAEPVQLTFNKFIMGVVLFLKKEIAHHRLETGGMLASLGAISFGVPEFSSVTGWRAKLYATGSKPVENSVHFTSWG